MASALTNWFRRIPRETRVAAVVLAMALLQVGVLAALGLDSAERHLDDVARNYADRGLRATKALASAATERIAGNEAAASDAVSRDDPSLDQRALEALRRAPLFARAYLVAADGAICDARRPPYVAVPASRVDVAVRARLAAIVARESDARAATVDAARALADEIERTEGGDLTAAALALTVGARSALAISDADQALRLAQRVLLRYRTVKSDGGELSDREPLGLSAAAIACDALALTTPLADEVGQSAFTAAVLDRREQVERLGSLISPAAARVEIDECRRLRDAVMGLAPAQRNRIDEGLRAADVLRAEIVRVASLRSAFAAAVASGEAARLRLPDGALVTLIPAPRAAPYSAAAFVAEPNQLVELAVSPALTLMDVPPGLHLIVRQDDGTVVLGGDGEPPSRQSLLVSQDLGRALPGLRAEAYVLDRSAIAIETETARKYWFWVLVGAALAVTAASLLAIRAVLREVRLARMKSDFVSNLSHELRTPLTSLRMFVETLQEGRTRDAAETKECIDIVAAETARLSSFVDRVLTFAAFEKGRASIEMKATDPSDVARRAADVFRKRAEAMGATLQLDAKPGLPATSLDRDAVIQVLLNLLDNAVKHGGESGAKIRLSVRAVGAETAFVVEDNGPGVPERERELVFEEFYRGDDTLSRRTQGVGIGLALAKRIALAHGGRIEVGTSKELGGAAFKLTLRAARDSGRGAGQ